MSEQTECQYCKYGEWRDGYRYCKLHQKYMDFWEFCWDFLDEDL